MCRRNIWKDSKELCSILSNIRKQIAEANGIEYVQTECTHTGPCCGTCPACEQELQDLERKLEEKKSRGEHVIIDCVSLFNEELLSTFLVKVRCRKLSLLFWKVRTMKVPSG